MFGLIGSQLFGAVGELKAYLCTHLLARTLLWDRETLLIPFGPYYFINVYEGRQGKEFEVGNGDFEISQDKNILPAKRNEK